MRVPRIYLETTMFNYYFDEEPNFLHTDTVKLFEEIRAGRYEAYTSDYVTNELKQASTDKRDKMINLYTEYGITVLGPNVDADELANLYVEGKIIPQKHRTDAQHIAVATVNNMDMILSLNFKHIVRKKTIVMTGRINVDFGYRPIEIYSPMEVVDRENS